MTALLFTCLPLQASEDILQQLISPKITNYCPKIKILPTNEIREMLHQEASTLHVDVINKVMTILKCTNQYNVEHNNILTIVDYSLPANQKRLWVFDLQDKKLLFHTYVSHGIKSGALTSSFFSNKYDSKTSSIGVYKTQQIYYGRDGLSLRLNGLDAGFNSNASNRYIVMHGGWYVEDAFIKKYGRSGRSWGCPAVPLDLVKPIIDTIKNNSLLIAYYPSDDWFSKSKFLKCERFSPIPSIAQLNEAANPVFDDSAKRDDVLLTNIHVKSGSEENTAVLVMSADNYERIFMSTPPLGRMLRRQINGVEYIALSAKELNQILATPNNLDITLNQIHLVKPTIKMVRGYYETQMQIINLGQIKQVTPISSNMPAQSYTIVFDTKNAMHLQTTDRFIRWLGL